MHQRTCKVIKTLNDVIIEPSERSDNVLLSYACQRIFNIPGIKLPMSELGWELVHTYFHSNLSVHEISSGNVKNTASKLNTTVVYDYFSENFHTSTVADPALSRSLRRSAKVK